MYFSVNKLRYELRCWLPGLPPFCIAKHLLTLHPGRGILRRNVYDVLQAARVPEMFLRPSTSGPCSRDVPAPTYKRPVFQRCSCAHLQAARVPEMFLRPPTSGPCSRDVPAPVPRAKIPTMSALRRRECYARFLLHFSFLYTVIVGYKYVARPPPSLVLVTVHMCRTKSCRLPIGR